MTGKQNKILELIKNQNFINSSLNSIFKEFIFNFTLFKHYNIILTDIGST